MSDSANVRSLEAIRRVREEVLKFAHRAGEGLDELEAEIRRVIDWIEHDRPGYWKLRVRHAYDAVGEAKANLHRCLMFPINDEQPSCAEERAELKRAEAWLDHCRKKQARVREWAQQLRHELHEYQGRTSALKQLLECDTPRAAALLDRSATSLERYVSSSVPAGGGAKGSGEAGGGEAADDPSAAEPAGESTNGAAEADA